MSTNLPIKPELLLCVCTLMPGAAGARAQKQRLGRDVMRLPANFSSAGQIAKIIQAQPPGKALELDVVKPPAVQAVARLLPVGTRVKGSDLILPNGNDFTIVKARSDREYASAFAARTITRAKLMKDLQSLQQQSSDWTVKAKSPHSARYVSLGDIAHALARVPALPSGT